MPQSIPEVLVFLWLLTRAVRDTKTLRACISLFFPEKLLQEASFESDPDFLYNVLEPVQLHREIGSVTRSVGACIPPTPGRADAEPR